MWGCSGTDIFLQLQKMQNRAAVIQTNSAFGASLTKKLGWMSIADLISFEPKQLGVKSINNQALHYICNLFKRNSDCSSLDLRDTATDLRPMNTSSNGQKRFSYRGAILWNNLAIGGLHRQAPFQYSSKSFF